MAGGGGGGWWFRTQNLSAKESHTPLTTRLSCPPPPPSLSVSSCLPAAGDNVGREHLVHVPQRRHAHRHGPSVFVQRHTAGHQDRGGPRSLSLFPREMQCSAKTVLSSYLYIIWTESAFVFFFLRSLLYSKWTNLAGSLLSEVMIYYRWMCWSIAVTFSNYLKLWLVRSPKGEAKGYAKKKKKKKSLYKMLTTWISS